MLQPLILKPEADFNESNVLLGFTLPKDFESASIEQMLDWGTRNWRLTQLPNALTLDSPF